MSRQLQLYYCTPLALTPLGTHKLHSSQYILCKYTCKPVKLPLELELAWWW